MDAYQFIFLLIAAFRLLIFASFADADSFFSY